MSISFNADEIFEITSQYINFLIAYVSKLKYFEIVAYEELYEIEKDRKIKVQNMEKIKHEITELNKLFSYEKPYYEEIYYSKKMSKTKIIGVSVLIGLFIGAFLSYILGIRDRRLNPNIANG